MSRREDFDNSFWDEAEIDALSPQATLLYIWSWTNRRCGMSGIYKIVRHRCSESKCATDELAGALAELNAAELLFYVDGWLWVKGRVKRLRPRSPQMAKSVRSDLEHLPTDHPFMGTFLDRYGNEQWLREALSDLHVNLTRTSGEVHVTADEQGDYVNVTPTSPEVQPNFHGKGKGKGKSNGSEKVGVVGGGNDLPEDFPEELLPHMRAVYRVLRALAQRQGAKDITVHSLAQTVMARRHKPLVRGAHDFAAWADGKAQKRRDVLAGYRNWLDNTDGLASVEPLTPDGFPATAGNVVPLNRKHNPGDLIRDLKGADFTESTAVEEGEPA